MLWDVEDLGTWDFRLEEQLKAISRTQQAILVSVWKTVVQTVEISSGGLEGVIVTSGPNILIVTF